MADELYTLTVVQDIQPGSAGWDLGAPACPVTINDFDADTLAWLDRCGLDWDNPGVWVLVTLADEDPNAVNVIDSRGFTPPLVNLTGHQIVVFPEEAPEVDPTRDYAPLLFLPPSGWVARRAVRELGAAEPVKTRRGSVPVQRVAYGELEGLPEPREGVRYIVSLTLALTSGRPDLLIPHNLVRRVNGEVIGCRGFGRVAASLRPNPLDVTR